MTYTPTRDGIWDFACDSYGKVQHSRKACVYSVVRGQGGERIVKVAARIDNWDDARLIARAPLLLRTLQQIADIAGESDEIQRLARRALGDTKWLKSNGGGWDLALSPVDEEAAR